MRILLIVPIFGSYLAFLRELGEALRINGHQVAVACAGCKAAKIEGLEFFHVSMARGANPIKHIRAASELREVLRKYRPDIVHAHFSAGILTTALAVRRSDPWCLWGTFQGLRFPLACGWKRWILRKMECFAASRCDLAHVLTSDDLSAFEEAGLSGRVLCQSGYGFGCADRFIDTPRPGTSAREKLKNTLGIPADAIVLLFVGRKVEFKGFALAVRAFMEISKENDRLFFLALGEADPFHSSGLGAREWEKCEEHPRFMDIGWQEDVLPWLDMADLFVFPSEREGMSVSVMEALARGLPCLCANARGTRELIRCGGNGFLLADRRQAVVTAGVEDAIRQLAVLGNNSGNKEVNSFVNKLRRSRWIESTQATYLTLLEEKVLREGSKSKNQ